VGFLPQEAFFFFLGGFSVCNVFLDLSDPQIFIVSNCAFLCYITDKMRLYLKMLNFLKPHIKWIAIAIVLAFLYVIFNGISLWVSVDFIQEIFTPSSQTAQLHNASNENASKAVSPLSGIGKNLTSKKVKNTFTDVLKQKIRSLLVRKNKADTLKLVCLVIFLSFLLKNVTYYLKRVITLFVELKIVTDIRNRLHATLLRLPLSFFEKRHSGTLTSIVFNDVNAMNTVLNESFGKLILLPIQIIGYIFILVSLSWKLSLITFLVVPLSGILILKIGQSVKRKSKRSLQRISKVLAVFQEAMTGIRIVKAFGGEAKETQRFFEENQEYFRLKFRQGKLSYLTSPLNEIFGVLTLVILLWFGGKLVIFKTGLAPEDFVRFLVFLFATFQPMKELAGINNVIQSGMAAAERIFSILEETPEPYEKPHVLKIHSFKKGIRYEHVHFRYKPEGPEVLVDIDFEIQKGETVAFVGSSGSGKTTLVSLLPRFYDVSKGRILFDEKDIRDLDLSSLRRQIGIVTQECILFHDTVRANIAYGVEKASDEDIRAAAEAANAWEFIQEMENGLDTRIGEKGVNLSGGQRQRISIARAILKNPPILILDEATSELDTESERLVQEAIEKLMVNRTVLVIAHRLSTVIHADKIVLLDRGRIVGMGTHRKLLASNPLYRRLYELQFQDVQWQEVK